MEVFFHSNAQEYAYTPMHGFWERLEQGCEKLGGS